MLDGDNFAERSPGQPVGKFVRRADKILSILDESARLGVGWVVDPRKQANLGRNFLS